MTYSPYENIWKQPDDFYHTEEHNKHEADALEEAFNSGNKFSARGVMNITNVEADIRPYLPYYTNDDIIKAFGASTAMIQGNIGGKTIQNSIGTSARTLQNIVNKSKTLCNFNG